MDRIWWTQVTNAVHYVDQITEALLYEKSVLIKHTSGMPWKLAFSETIEERVKLQNSEKRFVSIPVVSNPGDYLLHEFCKKEKRAQYRPGKGYSSFLAENDDIVLHDRYLRVEVDGSENLKKWMTFASDYIKERGKDNKAVFIFDLQSDEAVTPKKGIKHFSFDDDIGEYDRIVFSVLAASSIQANAFIKNYLAELVSNVAGNDIELCAECIKRYDEFLHSPVRVIKKILTESCRSDGTNYEYNKNDDEVERLIWLSQIKTIYPLIEEYREEFVSKHASAIQKQLPIQASYGETYDDPKDVELGTLKYMADKHMLVINTSEYEKLSRFKDARNKLSHLTAMALNEIEGII